MQTVGSSVTQETRTKCEKASTDIAVSEVFTGKSGMGILS